MSVFLTIGANFTYHLNVMPKIKSAKKALRQNIRRYAQNLEREKKLKAVIKEYKKLVGAGKLDEAKKYLSTLYKTIDKMAKVDFIKVGKAMRLKSRLTRQARAK